MDFVNIKSLKGMKAVEMKHVRAAKQCIAFILREVIDAYRALCFISRLHLWGNEHCILVFFISTYLLINDGPFGNIFWLRRFLSQYFSTIDH